MKALDMKIWRTVKTALYILVVAALAVALFFLVRRLSRPFLHSGRETGVGTITMSDLSPTRQLRVMSVYKEIIVGKTKTEQMLLGPVERKIYAIYPAQVNLGFDLTECGDDWLRVSGDTVYVKLPPVRILNDGGQYVDEARKRVPIQSGKWTWSEMNSLREMANKEMLFQCWRDGSFNDASAQGRAVVENLLKTLGYRNVVFDISVPAPGARDITGK